MRQKSFLILAGVTGASILAAAGSFFTGGSAPAFAAAGERLFPEMETAASEVAKFSIREGEFEMAIELRDGRFVDTLSGYPVNPEPLKKLVSGMTLAEIAEAKTTDPARHSDLKLADPEAEEGAGSEIILSDNDGDKIAHVMVGQRDFTLGGVTGGQFVRRGGEDASWLVRARLEPPTRRAGWFETRLMEVDATEIATASLTTSDGEVISMRGTDGELSVDPTVLGDRIPADNQLGRIVGLFETLDFEDVRAVEESDNPVGGAAVTSTLADGTAVTLSEIIGSEEEESFWVRIKVEGNTDTATELKAKTEGFEFAISSVDAGLFGWTLDDLTEEPAS